MSRGLSTIALAGLVALAALLAPSFARVTHACRCLDPPPVPRTFQEADAVFSGRVELLEHAQLEALFPDPRTQLIPLVDGFHARFAVIETWKGVAGRDLDVWTGRGNGDCGYGFERTEAYLVFARRTPNGRLVTGVCTNTQPLAQAVDALAALGPGSRALSPLPEEPPFQPWAALAAVALLAPVSFGAVWLLRGRRPPV